MVHVSNIQDNAPKRIIESRDFSETSAELDTTPRSSYQIVSFANIHLRHDPDQSEFGVNQGR